MSSHRQQPVAVGGAMFSSPKVNFSRETQDLLKVMMEESKLTNFQRRQLSSKLKEGNSLPLRCHPTSSKRGSPHKKPSSPSSSSARKPRSQLGSGLRSKEAIESRRATEEPDYRPPPCSYDSAKDKQRLQNVMAFGSELPPDAQLRQPRNSGLSESPEREVDRFDEVVREIEERREFLAEMESIGQGIKYRTQITTEISQRIYEMEEIDRERSRAMTELSPKPDTLAHH